MFQVAGFEHARLVPLKPEMGLDPGLDGIGPDALGQGIDQFVDHLDCWSDIARAGPSGGDRHQEQVNVELDGLTSSLDRGNRCKELIVAVGKRELGEIDTCHGGSPMGDVAVMGHASGGPCQATPRGPRAQGSGSVGRT